MPFREKPPSIWISTGEISGDLHGASLFKALRALSPSARLLGMGGPALRALGFESLFQVEELSVMGFTEVLGHLPKILRLLKNIEKRMAEEKPDALVVIDAPDFHFRLIKAARRLGIPVYYYISPKIWAWRQGRANFIRENVRRMISILPFEVDFYRKFGMRVDYVGNPLLDAIDLPRLDALEPQAGRIGFLPGSRRREVSSLMPEFGRAARFLKDKLPGLEFCCARAPGLDEAYLRSFWPEDLPIEFFSPDSRYEAMRRSQMLIAASGTAVLESALIGTPTIICYKLSPLTFSLGKMLVKVPFVGLPNLIAGREIFPEMLQEAASGESLARAALRWLRPEAGERGLAEVRDELVELRRIVGEPGATGRAASIILDDLSALLAGAEVS